MAALSTTYEAAYTALEHARRRGDDARQRLPQIDASLVDAVGKERSTLLTKRAELTAEVESQPAIRAVLIRRHVLAHLGFLAHVSRAAHAQIDQATTALEPLRIELARIDRRLFIDDARIAGAATLTEEQRAALQQERGELVRSMQADRARLSQAEMVVSICKIRAEQYGRELEYGRSNTVSLGNPSTWQAAADRAAHADDLMSRAPIVRSLPHAALQ